LIFTAARAASKRHEEQPMNTRERFRLLMCGLLAGALVALLAARTQSEEKAASNREREIAEIEKQIEQLNKRLAELRGTNGANGTAGSGALPADWIKALTWRSIGPAAMGGRITAISVYEADPTTYFVATASGGLLKTVNNGITFEHQFDKENVVSIGDVCVAPSDRNIVWVGSGEGNPRNSVSYGDGVYKSTDGGKTWKNMGLRKSFQIGRIAIHPKDPNIVYVGALGRLYGPNEERGLYKTTDGGQTWAKVLKVDDKTGVIDMRMHPNDPETLLVATYERQRDGFDVNEPAKRYGPGSALWKTTDGGKTFHKLTKGLPTVQLGRIGIDYHRKDPNTVYVVLESEKNGMGTDVYMGIIGEDAAKAGGAKLTEITKGGPAEKAGFQANDVVVSFEDKPIKSYSDLAKQIASRKVGDKVKATVSRAGKNVDIELTMGKRPPAEAAQGGPRGGPTVFLGLFGETVEDAGIRLSRILEESPAEKAGLKEGDVVSAIDGKKVRSSQEIQEILREHKAGDKVKVQASRAGKTLEISVTLEGRQGMMRAFTGERADPSRPFMAMLNGQTENVQDQQGPDGFQNGGVYKSTDGGESWTRVNSVNPRPMYFSQIRVDPNDDKLIYVLGVELYRSTDGGANFKRDVRGVHADQHALWINLRDSRHMILGCDGGFYATYDRMAHWDHLNHLAIGQFYHAAVDVRPHNYYVYGGLQDNGSWGGPSQTRTFTGPVNEDWIMVGGGDGFVCQVDPNDPDLVYYESQNGGLGRRHLKTGETASLRPPRTPGERYRFNWKTPFILSHHNSRIYYCAGNFVFRSLDRGNDLRIISPEITRTKQGSATAIAESPKNPNVLYVGTDDGALWGTRDGGKEWVNLLPNVGLPGPRYVATIEASRFDEGRAYVAFDGHRSDDDSPYLYVTEDFGKTWKPIHYGLPLWGSTRCLREDVQNVNLLYVGTEFGAWVSVDRGASWTKLNNNLPTVAVHDFAIHPTAGEIVAATHGRSLWVLDVTALRQVTPELVHANAHLYKVNPAARVRSEPSHGGTSRRFVGQNGPVGAQIYYSLAKKTDQINLKIVDFSGRTIRELRAEGTPGLHHVSWDLALASNRQTGPAGAGRRGGGSGGEAAADRPQRQGRGGRQGATGTPAGGGTANAPAAAGASGAAAESSPTESEQPQGRQGGGGFGRRSFGPPAPPGTYRVVLTVDGKEYTQNLRVEGEATAQGPIIAPDNDEETTPAPKEVTIDR
jgi:photosystem II stability/assembly factor-like uncharacterized protein